MQIGIAYGKKYLDNDVLQYIYNIFKGLVLIKSVYKLLIISFLLLSSGIVFAATVEIEINWTNFSGDNFIEFREPNGSIYTTRQGGENFICDPDNCFTGAGNTTEARTITFLNVPAADGYTLFLDDAFNGWNSDGAGSYVTVRVNGVVVVNQNPGPTTTAGSTVTFNVTDTAASVGTQTCSSTSLTGTWTAGATSTSTSGSIPVSVSFVADSAVGAWTSFNNDTMNNIAAWSDAAVQSNDSLLTVFEWDTAEDGGSDPIYSATATNGSVSGGDGTTGSMTFSFGGRTVYNPIIHLDRIGGTDGAEANSARFTFSSGTVERLAGPGHFETFSNNSLFRSIYDATAGTQSSLNTATGTGAGSVVVSGSFSSLGATLEGIGPEAAGADEFEMVICVPQADLSLTQNISDSTPAVGTEITIFLTISNGGPDTAEDIQVTDLLPAGLSFVSASESQGSYDDATGIWTVGSLANTGSATLSIVVEVTSSSTITNVATITNSDRVDPDSDFTVGIGADDLSDGTADDDETSENINPVLSSDIQVTKSDFVASYTPGGTDSFTITITNDGPSDVTGVSISDLLPDGVTLLQPWECTASAGSACSGATGGSAGDTSVSLTADILDSGTITLEVFVIYSTAAADY